MPDSKLLPFPGRREINHITNWGAPRWPNGSISHRSDVPELWADFVYMAPPFLAYYAADTNNLKTSYVQCPYYRHVLLFGPNATSFSPPGTSATNGLWRHIVGPQPESPGQVPPVAATAAWRDVAIWDLTGWIREIVEVRVQPLLDGGLLRNYLNDTSSAHGFVEISGTAMLAAVAYRMGVHAPGQFPASTYAPWADGIPARIAGNDAKGKPHVTAKGLVNPAVNPLACQDTVPWTAGSPEGNNFVVPMCAAWRDCVGAGLCKA
ncbi:hypothetical protein C8R43DRAFT_1242466 [Mycena crocata]|nr:hypothetical protein C8R43DRAFT_1242466 [Mycena crocata]